jgi:glycosyltransferase involved in cell wall biosynthesis
MKICVTRYAYHPFIDGFETHLVDLCSDLVEQGHEVHALVGTLRGQPDEQCQHGVQIHRRSELDVESVRRRKTENDFEAEVPWKQLQRELRAFYRGFVEYYDIDLVHAHNFHHVLPEYALALSDLHNEGLPTVLTIHEMGGQFICAHLLEATKWDAIIAGGKHVQHDVEAAVPGISNLTTILHGAHLNIFRPGVGDQGLREKLGLVDRPIILHPARMPSWEGAHVSVAAMRAVVETFPTATLVITDTNQIIDWTRELRGYKQEILDTIEAEELSRNVIPQSFDYFDLPRVYALADVVIYPPTGDEPFGLVPLEAMACGRPVIVSRSGGLVESVVDGVTGYVIEKNRPDQLAERTIRLLSNADLREGMGKAGRNLVEQHFSRRRMTNETLELYDAAIDAGRRRRARVLVAASRSI